MTAEATIGLGVKTALVILDMLVDFVDGVLANPSAKAIVDPIASLADQARAHPDWVVIYGNDAHRPDDFELAVFGEHAMAGSPGAAVIPELAPQSDDIIVPKRYYSAFTETDLDATCRVHDIGRLVVAGQHTDCCVRHTSYDAFQRGIEVVVPTDATIVFEPLAESSVAERQHSALDYLKTFYGAEVLASDHVF